MSTLQNQLQKHLIPTLRHLENCPEEWDQSSGVGPTPCCVGSHLAKDLNPDLFLRKPRLLEYKKGIHQFCEKTGLRPSDVAKLLAAAGASRNPFGSEPWILPMSKVISNLMEIESIPYELKVDLSSENFEEFSFLNQSSLVNTDFSNCNLKNTQFPGMNLMLSDFSFADLTGADLSCVDLTGADLSNANLTGADLSSAKLTGAMLQNADLTSANLKRTDMDNACLIDAKLLQANLSEASLNEADLTNANLQYVDFNLANLLNAIVVDANLHGAKLQNSICTNVDFYGSKLTMAIVNKKHLLTDAYIKPDQLYDIFE